jgi:phage tail-like protein
MARPSRKDPLDKYRWTVQISGFERLGFTAVEVPAVTFSTTEYHEGGAHLFPRQIIDKASYKPVTLLRGVSSGSGATDFTNWAQQVLALLNPEISTTDPNNSRTNQLFDYRRDVVINHLNRAGNIVRTYTLYNAIPVEFQPASDFSADADDTFSIEKLVLKYESFDVTTSDDKRTATDIKDITKKLIRNAF